ncbi:porphobilinogen synthase [Paenibacillus elgii]|uniref:Delta-aminolevulinic acid dehydratase n=1 Tax=Paenibacillus elgii TaxID=189691 RepID=A0A165QIQ7_9BACL|nr:porphobilinogen synthase [Paenibacillus elgii]KZE75162.1 delta-aminolevulinic acid dehydratase [Paenibacillus elgii]MCM3270901.1 porphobilinogen synthase [Paenibacillus elgii]NEN86001.1 porphobilinogen synthase [Paenibacillus elgii]
MSFPLVRNRRLRSSAALRNLVREHTVTLDDLLYPIFVTHGTNIKEEISSMPGVYHFSLDRLEEEIREIVELGLPAIVLFGVPHEKDAHASSAYDPNGIVQQASRLIKTWAPELLIVADTCLCQFMDHGHCGVVHYDEAKGRAEVLNDASLDLLVKTAVSQAEAGADIIAPSNMMDGFVYAIRQGLDEAGYEQVPIMSYSVKYASSFYGPFREAAHSTPQFGDRKTYQMDPANVREALREAESDVAEGADMLMVKPALAYMDVVRALREKFNLPLVVYNVSGEYSLVKAAAMQGWVDEKSIVMETMTGFKRAGADMIITYFAKDIARWLRN